MMVCLNIAAQQCDYAVLALLTITGNTKRVMAVESRVNVFVTD
jgi:hypothetical protein